MRLTKMAVKTRVELELEDAAPADVQELVRDAEGNGHRFEITQKPGGSFKIWAEFGDDLQGVRQMIKAIEELAIDDGD